MTIQLATDFLQKLYYRVTIRAGSRAPEPGHPTHILHRRRINVLILTLYLVYTFLQALYDIRLAGSFYTLLDVTPSSPEKEIRAKFRRLAARYHPDKLPATSSAEAASHGEQVFHSAKTAHDTLLEPALRFAYEHFGPGITKVQTPSMDSVRAYVFAGLRALAPEYVKMAATLVVLNYFFLNRWGQFWRYMGVLGMVVLELYLLTHNWRPGGWAVGSAKAVRALAPGLLPPRLLPFQILELARRMVVALNVFISRLAPREDEGRGLDAAVRNQEAVVSNLVRRVETEAGEGLSLGVAPFRGSKGDVKRLRDAMKEGLVTRAVREHPEVKEAVRKVLERRGKES